MRKIKQHTLQKLEYFEKYINAYLSATKRLPKKYYIDAFAGCGKCVVDKMQKIVYGSPLISLKSKNVFDSYILIEQNKKNFKELEITIDGAGISKERIESIKLYNKDCNKFLKNFHFDSNAGHLIFLDPEGPELLWETIYSLSKVKKADLLILYPYDMALVRLVKDYKEKLNKFYGTTSWLNIYEIRKNAADAKKKLLDFYINNLKKLGFELVVYRQIRTKIREGKPLYHLILATHSPVGDKIMSDIFGKELDGQTSLKFN